MDDNNVNVADPYLVLARVDDPPIRIRSDEWHVIASGFAVSEKHWVKLKVMYNGKKIIGYGHYETQPEFDSDEAIEIAALFDDVLYLSKAIAVISHHLRDRTPDDAARLVIKARDRCFASLPPVEVV